MSVKIVVSIGQQGYEMYECLLTEEEDSKAIKSILLQCSKICQIITGEKEPDLDIYDLPIFIRISPG